MAKRQPRIAIVHDWMVSPGGAERTVLAMHEIWPDAPIYTAAYIPEKFPEFADADVRTTWLNHIGLAKRRHQLFSVPRAWAFRLLNLSRYDVVISSSSAESKYVHTGKHALHICYCHTPIRYYWSDYDWYLEHPPFGRLNWLAKLVLPALIGPLRRMDYRGAQRVDAYVANSVNIQKRIKKYYHRDSIVIHPPIETRHFTLPHKDEGYYLVVGRQVAYKRLDLVVDAFNKLGLPLIVAGAGEEVAVQKPRANSNIRFAGRVSDEERSKLFAGARAFIFPPEEDFGMTPIEAMAAGCPVIAYAKGGALEYVVEGKTGILFSNQTADDLVEAVKRSQEIVFEDKILRNCAAEFDEEVFKSKLKEYVDHKWAEFQNKRV